MMREEFNELVSKEMFDGKPFDVGDEEYKIIETVYGFHPSISDVDGKEQIARLYVNFGFIIIADMYPRAKAAETLYIKRRDLEAQHNAELSRLSEQENLINTASISHFNKIIYGS